MTELVREQGGPRFYIDGVPLHCGDGVQVELDDWTDFRFEWSCHDEDHICLYFDRAGCLRVSMAEFLALNSRMPKPTPFRGML